MKAAVVCNPCGIRPLDIDVETPGVRAVAKGEVGEVENEIIETEGNHSPIQLARDPGDPTEEERDAHWMMGHAIYRSWCPVCVKARGKEEAHKKQDERNKSCKNTVCYDYKTFGQEENIDDKATTLICKDEKTKMRFAHVCENKGASDEWVMQKLLEDMERLGHTEVIIKSDGEPALVQVMEKLKERRSHPTIVQHPPAYDPQAHGAAEQTVQDFMGQVRAMKIALEARLQSKVESDWAVMQWMVEWAPELINRCRIGQDGRTSYFRLYGKDSRKAILEFAEQVMAKPLRGKKSGKKLALRERWVFGAWVGLDPKTNEHVVILADGGAAIRVRTVLRRPMSDRWSVEALKTICSTPRRPNPADFTQRKTLPERQTKTIKVEIEENGEDIKMPEAREKEFKCREFRITKSILDVCGYTERCKGCDAAIIDGPPHGAFARVQAPIETLIVLDDTLENLRSRLENRDTRLHPDPLDASGKVLPDLVTSDVRSGSKSEKFSMMADEQENHLIREVLAEPGHVIVTGSQPSGAADPTQDKIRKVAEKEREMQVAKKRRLNLLMAEKRIIRKVDCDFKCGSERRKINALLHTLEFGNQSQENRRWDISKIIAAVASEMATPHDEVENLEMWQNMYANVEFHDDVNGCKHLPKDLVIVARSLEMKYIRKMGVYRKVTREEARRRGCKVITTRWIDTNKGDDENPNVRCRPVARKLSLDKRLDLFAATPPLETIKMLLPKCAKGQAQPKPLRIGIIDIKRAYFYAPARRPVFIEIPREDWEEGDEGRVGRLEMSLYGTRDAAQNWASEYSQHLATLGFRKGVASPCNFHHQGRNVSLTVHGDDFVVVGSSESLKWLIKNMKPKYELKADTLGPDKDQVQEVRVLDRVIRWTPNGLEYEPDQRHADMVVKQLGLEKCRHVSTPSAAETAKEKQEREISDHELDGAEASEYRSISARVNYLAADRADLQYASKEAAKHMAKPKKSSWRLIKRIGRYLAGKPRVVQQFPWAEFGNEVQGYCDSDWAGDQSSQKSTSGGALVWGRHTLKTWSTAQNTLALSSGEAELYAATKVAVQLKGLMSMALDFDIKLKGTIRCDANAAIGIIHRQGLGGRSRHIKVQYLWIQTAVKDKELDIRKIPGTNNPADMFTKAVNEDLLSKYVKELGYREYQGRAEKASKLLNAISNAFAWAFE